MNVFTKLVLTITCLAAYGVPVFGQDAEQDWPTMSDEAFAAKYADMAFNGSLKDRQRIAWMFFVRVNQLIDDPANGGMSGSGKVPVWMAWPTDPDTFATKTPFDFDETPRSDMRPSAEKKDIEAGSVSTANPDGANEEVTRNKTSYDYLIRNRLTTKRDIAAFFANEKNHVDMPVGSVELKASWLQVTKGSPAPNGALTFKFDGGEYWWRGLHIMVKMKQLSNPSDVFYSEEPSWFWTTFEFNNNPGVDHVRESLITQRAPLSKEEVRTILDCGGVAKFGIRGVCAKRNANPLYRERQGQDPCYPGSYEYGGFRWQPQYRASALLDAVSSELPQLPRHCSLQPRISELLSIFGAYGRAASGLQHGGQQRKYSLPGARLQAPRLHVANCVPGALANAPKPSCRPARAESDATSYLTTGSAIPKKMSKAGCPLLPIRSSRNADSRALKEIGSTMGIISGCQNRRLSSNRDRRKEPYLLRSIVSCVELRTGIGLPPSRSDCSADSNICMT